MLNKFWSFLVLSAILLAALKGQPQVITEAALDAASNSVQYALGLIGLMSFWLGVMNVAEKAGLVDSGFGFYRPQLKRQCAGAGQCGHPLWPQGHDPPAGMQSTQRYRQ